ncbi:MAG: putative inner membrane protein [Candidatus Methanofastidiosum methylothiophilum]|uniref:Putative inner membrane protein n=1 Tax=Candidatus Methanofastidiosum methylothiophilum TaxID=1705564 RepID=A0A150IMS1_9EURY|nr:MAG: putative inner membrane protein [Candidatus Methanofastidiosum methylthiophilus]KYC48107.1 MAG: putative inner membrane protein [Candidatus Methanofastidiosum methylthiophilus]KYC50654.1 MAG: putative inner membrane protein [Candidatus Methanofastidiosum methylthiophilus]
MEESEYRIAIASIFIFFLIIAALTLFPLVDALIVTFVLVYLMRPINTLLLRFMNKTYAAILSALAVAIPAFLLFFYLAAAIINYVMREKIFERLMMVFSDLDTYSKNLFLSFLNYFNIEYSEDLDKISNILTSKLHELISYISEEIIDLTIHIPEYAIKLLLASILALYLIKEGVTIKDTFVSLLPDTKKKTISSLLQGIDIVFESIILVNILKAILTSIISYFIFLAFGVPYPLLLGILSGFMDFAPILGPWMLFSGIAAVYIINGQAMAGIYIFILGQLLVTVIPELYIKPKLAGKYAKIHPMIFLFGFFGGLLAFGPIGIFVGPLAIGIVIVFIKYYLLGKEIESKSSLIDKLLNQVDKMIKIEGGKNGKL